MFKSLWDSGYLSRVFRVVTYPFRQHHITGLITSKFYWFVAPKLYNRYSTREVKNPYQLYWIDPMHITRWSGRKNAYKNRWEAIGSVQDGNWDLNLPYDRYGWLNEILFAASFEESIFYQSFKSHFIDEIPWSDTELVSTISRHIDNGDSYHQCNTADELQKFFNNIDQIYISIKNKGYMAQEEIQKSTTGGPYASFKTAILNEISVDIGRNGEPLFVDGKHRLAIAKLLELEKIPVIVLARHSNYYA